MTLSVPMTTDNASTEPTTMVAGARPLALVPRTLEEASCLAKTIVASGLAPQGLDTPEACLIAILHGLELGLTPLAAIQRIAVIDRRPTLWGDGALALVRASGLCQWVREDLEGESTEAWSATCSVKRRGEGRPVERRFSVQDARRAGLWGRPGPWSQYPQRMLQMRARAFALRDAFADVLGGLYVREELEDVETGGRWTSPAPLRAPPPAPPSDGSIHRRAGRQARDPGGPGAAAPLRRGGRGGGGRRGEMPDRGTARSAAEERRCPRSGQSVPSPARTRPRRPPPHACSRRSVRPRATPCAPAMPRAGRCASRAPWRRDCPPACGRRRPTLAGFGRNNPEADGVASGAVLPAPQRSEVCSRRGRAYVPGNHQDWRSQRGEARGHPHLRQAIPRRFSATTIMRLPAPATGKSSPRSTRSSRPNSPHSRASTAPRRTARGSAMSPGSRR